MRSNFNPKEIKKADKILSDYLTEAKTQHKKGKRLKILWSKIISLFK